ncbi:putative bifunctional diguanylate cyclase/phosphodiesterase [Castellaniella sp.]|uniref:putative bifunctional diguanylate cyclase/phosphodiesterase n=1 Tax=Castellaniella sp. TaxID=1955812 RepID=UPI002AFEB653|nr:EAL domain-containing protein [Castellaniella sp.]
MPSFQSSTLADSHARLPTRPSIWVGIGLLLACNALLITGLLLPAARQQQAVLWLGLLLLLLTNTGAWLLIRHIRHLQRQALSMHHALAHTQAMFNGLDGNTVIGIYMVNKAVQFTYASPQLAQILGYEQQALADNFPLDRIFPPETYQKICVRADQRLSGTVAHARYECPAIRQDGTPIEVEVYGSQIMLGGQPTIIGMMLDITERKRVEAAVWHQAHFDSLTQLPNRQAFQQQLQANIDLTQVSGQPFALVFLDLDEFKEINDSHGHDVGDALLQQVAQRLQACIRDTDLLARLGGDEFTLILAAPITPAAAHEICQRVLQTITRPFTLQHQAAQISISAGLTFFPQDGADATTLLKHADLALYAAKNLGRNRYCVFQDSMRQAAQDHRELLQDLHAAVHSKAFQLLYQPVVDMHTGRTIKAEALIRWLHPQRGLIKPMDFIPLAEESGLIVPIGDWVFHTASQQLAQWRQEYLPDFVIGINVSPAQFKDDGLDPAAWISALHALGLPGSALTVEITEQVLMGAENWVSSRLLQFRDAGIQVALDDFGTGYSSLAYLQRFDVDYIKIDQCFVRNLSPESSDRVLCQAIIAMAHQLGLKVIAEGIETEDQHWILKNIDCDYGQGYWHARPMTAEQLALRLQAERGDFEYMVGVT